MRKTYIRYAALFIALLALACPLFAANPLQVAVSGVAQCPIYYKQTTQGGLEAANALKAVLDRVTGGNFSVQSWNGTGTPRAIIIGTAAEFSAKASTHGLTGLNAEGFAVWNESGTGWEEVWIVANSSLGCRDGVYALAEDTSMGCRFFMPKPEWHVYPSNPNLTITTNITANAPVVGQRSEWYAFSWDQTQQDNWLNWKKMVRQGGWFQVQNNPSWSSYLPYATYFGPHPEWYALRDGVRVQGQLCVSNTAMQAQFLANVDAELNANPSITMVPIEPEDGNNFCDCANCRAIGNGSDSDEVYSFANVLCDHLATSYPGKLAGLFAYDTHSIPPSFSLRNNLYLELTTGFRGGQTNSFAAEAAAFRAKGVYGLGVYDYIGGWIGGLFDQPSSTPSGQYWMFGDRMKSYFANSAYMFTSLNGEGDSSWGPNGLGYYIGARVAWNPSLTVDSIVDDWCTKLFGSASSTMKTFYTRWGRWPNGIPPVKLAMQDLKTAYTQTSDPAVTARLDMLAMYVHYLKLYNDWLTCKNNGGDGTAQTPYIQAMSTYMGRIATTEMTFAIGYKNWAYYWLFNDVVTQTQTDQWFNDGLTAGVPSAYEVQKNLNEDIYACDSVKAVDTAMTAWTANPYSSLVSINTLRPDRVTAWGSQTASDFYIYAGNFYFNGNSAENITITCTPYTGQTLGGTWTLMKASDGSIVSSGNISSSFQVTLPATGTYIFMPNSPTPAATKYAFSSARPVSMVAESMNMPRYNLNELVNPLWNLCSTITTQPYGYIYVPMGSTSVVLNLPHADTASFLKLVTADGTIASYTTTGTYSNLITAPVPPGKDGQIWRIRIPLTNSMMQVAAGAAPFIADSPANLLLPKDYIRLEANNMTISTNESTTHTGTLSASQVDSAAMTYSIVTNGSHGTATITNSSTGAFNYVPTTGYWGADSFTFKVTDATGPSNIATVSVTVNSTPGASAPVGYADSYTTTNQVFNIVAPGVLTNDTDANSDKLTAVLVTAPTKGHLTLNTDGSFTYVTNASQTAASTDSFVYRATDGTYNSANTTVSLTFGAFISTTNLKAWFRADEGITKDASNYVGTWQEKSASLLNFTQATQGNKPLWVASSLNGQPAVQFDGVDDNLSATTNLFNSSTNYTIIGVVNPGATQMQYAEIFKHGYIVSISQYYADCPWFNWFYDGTSYQNFDSQQGALLNSNAGNLVTYCKNGTTLNTYLNNTLVHTATVTTPLPAVSDLVGIGGWTYFFNGKIGDLIVYNRALTDNERGTLTAYLNAKYGLGRIPDNPTTDSYTATEDTTLNVAASGVLSNDTDSEKRMLTAKLATYTAHGNVTLNADGSFSYRAFQDYYGADSFTYVTNNGFKNSAATGTVNLTVNSVDDAPTCSITSPANGSTVYQPAPIHLVASAEDVDGTVTKVEFYRGTTLILSDTVSPYECIDAGLTNGTYSYTAKAYESPGTLTTTSPAVSVTLATAPAPNTISNLAAWYKADAGVTKDGSNYVTQWADQSGNGVNLTVPGGASSPVWQSAGLNGKNSIRFDSSGYGLLSSSFNAGSTGLSVIYGCKTASTVAPYSAIVSSGHYTGGTSGIAWMLGPFPADSYALGYTGTDGYASGPYLAGTAAVASTWYLNSYTYDKTTWKLRENTVAKPDVTDGSWPTGTFQLHVGRQDQTYNYGFNGDIGDICIYTRALTTNEIGQVESYIRGRYDNAPTGNAQSFRVVKSSTNTGTLVASDADGDVLTYRIVQQGTLGTAEVTGLTTGAFIYTANGTVGTDTIKFRANDGYADSADITVTVTIWDNQDIGTVGIAGSGSLSGTTFTIAGAGAGVTGTADAFHFVNTSISGNCTIIARVATFTSANANARAGVMMRQSNAAGAIEASSLFYPGSTKRVYFHRRTTLNGNTSTNNSTAAATPYWVKLVRSTNTLSAWKSANGTTWTQVGSNTTVTMTNPILIGLAVTNGSTTATATATFDNVSITSP